MKTYQIVYWFGSITTEQIVKAETAQEAEAKFRETKGDRCIVSIREVGQWQ